MFTGIVTHLARLLGVEQRGEDRRLLFEADDEFLEGCKPGDSIAVSGVCLTAVDISGNRFVADVSVESLRCTTIGQWQPDQRVNLERSMRADGRFDGHMVSGHVDGIATLKSTDRQARSLALTFEVDSALSKFVARKGSACLDGVSLTVNEVNGNLFTVNIIPHTQDVTRLGELQVGGQVNIEVDIIARYLHRLFGQSEGETR